MRTSFAGWSRIAVVAALIAALSVAALLSPATAGSRVSKGFVKKFVTRRIEALRQELSNSIKEVRLNASSTQRVGPVAISGSATDVAIAVLAIPDAGNYVVTAKLWWNVINATSTGVGGEIDCDLLADSAFDTSRESGVTDFDYGTLSLQLTQAFPGPTTVTLRCRDEFTGGNPVEAHNVVITATEVFALSSTSIPRGETPEPVPSPRP